MNDMSVRKAVPFALLLTLTAAVFAQGARRDGKWEVTVQMEMPGMPAGRGMPAMTSTQCITKEQVDDPQKFGAQPPSRGGPNDCKVSDYKVVGNTVTYSMKCTTPQEMTMTGEFVYGDNKYDGVTKITTSRGGQPMDMTMKMTGKRLGDCTP
jgi:hypothetical protein